MVENRVKNFGNVVDPSGLVEWTEQTAKTVLDTEVARFKEKKWVLAASFLQRFLDGTGGQTKEAPYSLNDEEKSYVVTESTSAVRRAIVFGIGDLKQGRPPAVGQKFNFSEDIRWVTTPQESRAGFIYDHSERVIIENNGLFYAYGGANLKLEGEVTKVNPNARIVQGTKITRYDVKVKATIKDNYFFPADWIRSWVDEHDAARFLQVKFPAKYKPFFNTVTFENTYEDLSYYQGGRATDGVLPSKNRLL